MGVLIILGLMVVVWKVIDLAKQKAAREKREAMEQAHTLDPATLSPAHSQKMIAPFAYDLSLSAGERILETSAAANGLWIRIGSGGMTNRIILKDFDGKTIGKIMVKQNDKNAVPAN